MSDEVQTGVEVERKYDVPDEEAVPALESLGFDVDTTRFTLTATYFDTPDNALADRRMTLRRREGGHDAGWHLKTPHADGRAEHQMPLSDELPESLRELIAEILDGSPVVAIARLVTDRTAIILTGPDGAAAEIADDRVTATDLREGIERNWREWEAELLDGAPASATERTELMERLEQALLASGAVPSSSASKLARAIGRAPLPGE